MIVTLAPASSALTALSPATVPMVGAAGSVVFTCSTAVVDGLGLPAPSNAVTTRAVLLRLANCPPGSAPLAGGVPTSIDHSPEACAVATQVASIVPSRPTSSATLTREPGSALPRISGVVSAVISGLVMVGAASTTESRVMLADVIVLGLPAASVAITDNGTGMPSTSVIGVPSRGLSTAVSMRQAPPPPAVVS